MKATSPRVSWFVSGLALVAMAMASRPAEAQWPVQTHGFVCSVQLVPGAGILGQHGYLNFKLFSDPHCAGTVKASIYACSTGGQAARPCERRQEPNGSFPYLYNEEQLNALYENLVVAAAEQFQVSVLVGSEDRLWWVAFFTAGYVADEN